MKGVREREGENQPASHIDKSHKKGSSDEEEEEGERRSPRGVETKRRASRPGFEGICAEKKMMIEGRREEMCWMKLVWRMMMGK